MQILQGTMQKNVCNIGLIFEMLNYSVIKQGTLFWEINIKKKEYLQMLAFVYNMKSTTNHVLQVSVLLNINDNFQCK